MWRKGWREITWEWWHDERSQLQGWSVMLHIEMPMVLEIMLPRELRTQKLNKWHCKRWSMYRTGCTYSTVCVCTCLCCGVARLTTTQISQHTPWGSTLPKKRTKNERSDKRKEMITPWNHTYQSVTNQSTPKKLPSKQTKIQEYKGIPKILIQLLRSSIPQS